MMFVLANSLHSGKRAGVFATFGIMVGGIFHTVTGLSLVIAASRISPLVFQTMMTIGAAYMIYIGYGLAKSKIFIDKIGHTEAPNFSRAFYQGVMTCVLNPKAYAFVLAVYPNFLKPEYGSVYSQAAVMGLMTIVTQFIIYGTIAIAAEGVRNLLFKSQNSTIWASRLIGFLSIFAAILSLYHSFWA